MDTRQINRELTAYISRLKKTVKPEKVILFGSFARGEATEWSDIDILVVAPFDNVSEKNRFDMLYDLHEGLIVEHDINAYGLTPQEFESAPEWNIVHEIKNEGFVVYDTSKERE